MPIPLHVDSTMLSAFRLCETKAKLEFGLGLHPGETSIDLHAGSCLASGLEELYRRIYVDGKSRGDALGFAELAFLREWGDYPLHEDSPKSRDNMLRALEQYADHYHPPNDHIRPYLDNSPTVSPFEFGFAIPLDEQTTGVAFPLHPSGQPFIYCGRFDMIGLLEDVPVIRDDKTAKQLEKNWSHKWALRGQFIGYVWAMQTLGWKLDTVIVRGIILYKTKPAAFPEAQKSYPRFLIDRWLMQTKRDLERWTQAERDGYASALGEPCSMYGGCSYLDLCTSPQPERWYSTFNVRHWNPLLRNPLETEDEAA